MSTKRIAVIGGTGLNSLVGVTEIKRHQVSTDFGRPSADVTELRLEHEQGDVEFFFLPRHGSPHGIAPHLINYRANMAALQALDVDQVVAVNAVGGIDTALQPKDIVIPEQVIDYTWGRESSFFDGTLRPLDHFDFSDPFDSTVRSRIIAAANETGIATVNSGVYGVTQGPRLETAAEIKRMARDGATIVGMTLMPEAVLARELAMSYGAISLVVNPAAGVVDTVITMEEIRKALADGMGNVHGLLLKVLSSF